MEKVRLLILVLAVPALINGENDDKHINENVASEVDPRWKMELLNRFQEVEQVNWPQRHQAAFLGERPTLIELPHDWQQRQRQDSNRNEFQGTFNDIEVLNQFNEIRQPNHRPEFKHRPEFTSETKREMLQRPLQGISTSILVPLIPIHVDPMGNTVRIPATFQRQERQSNLVNDRTIVPPHLRLQKTPWMRPQDNDNHFEEQRNVENQHQRPGQFQQVQVPVFVPQNKNQKLEENFLDKTQQQFRPPFNAFPQQNDNRFHNRPNEQQINLIQQNENQNDGRQNRNFRQAKEQVPNIQSENMQQNGQRPFSSQNLQNQELPANNHPLLPSIDLTSVPIPPILDFSDNNAQNRPPPPVRDASNMLPFPPRDASMFPPKDGPIDKPFPPRDGKNRTPFPSRDVANGPPFLLGGAAMFPPKKGPNEKPFPPREMTKGPPFPLRDEPNSNFFPHRDVQTGATSPSIRTALTDKPFPLRESGNDASFQFREPPKHQFERDQESNNNRPQFQFFNQNPERMPNQNQRQPLNLDQQLPNQNQHFPNQNQQNPDQNQRNPNQNQLNLNQNQQHPDQNQRNPNQNQRNPNQNQHNPNPNQPHPDQNQFHSNQNEQHQMPFMNQQQQQFANNQQPPQFHQNRQPHQLPFNNQRPHPEMLQRFENQNRPFFHPNRDPNFDRHFNGNRPDFNFPPFSKDEMSLPEISNALTSAMPNNNGPPRPPFEFSQGPPRPPFTGPPQIFRPPQGPQMTQPKNVEVPKIFGDFPSEPKFDRSPWIPVTPLPKIARKPIASSSREALRVENPPTNSFSTTSPSISTISDIGEHFEALSPTSTPTQPERNRFRSTVMTPISTLISLTTIAPPVSDRSPKIDVISANQTNLDGNNTLDERFNRLRRLPEALQFFDRKPIEIATVEPDFTTPTIFFPPSNNNIDSTPWPNEPLTDVPIASSLSITESIDFPSTTPTQEMSSNLRQISVEQLYRHWKNQFAQHKINEQEPSTTERSNATSFTQPQETFAQPQETFTQPQETFTQPQETFTQPQETFTHPQETFTQPQETFTQPQETFTQPQTAFTQPDTAFTQPQIAFTGNRGIVNEALQALDLRPSDWSQRTSPRPSISEATSVQPPQIQTPETYGRREESQSNSVDQDRRRQTDYFSATTEQYPQMLSSESVVTPNYVTVTATTPKKRVKSFTQKVLVRRRKILKAKAPRTQDVTVHQIEYSTPSTF